jgi:dimethylargininase
VRPVSPATRLVAITHVPSPNIQRGERTHVDDAEIDYELALRQHAAYRDALRKCGAEVVVLDVNRTMPDCVFVEDTAVVLEELAIMMSPGAASRHGEPAGIEPSLKQFREVKRVVRPATIDGGDVVVAGKSVYIGESRRTNGAGISALRELLPPFGYTVEAVSVHGCLHLKSACSALPGNQFLVNRDWIDVSPLSGTLVDVPPHEAWAGDVLVIGERIIVSDAFPATIQCLVDLGYECIPVSVSEFAKAEGGVTCLSLVFQA